MPKRYSKSKRSLKLKRKSLKSRRRNSKLKRSLKRKKGGFTLIMPQELAIPTPVSGSSFYSYMRDNYYDPNIFDFVIKVLIEIVEKLIVLQGKNQVYLGYYLEDIEITKDQEQPEIINPTITFNYNSKTENLVEGPYPVDNIILRLGVLILTIYNISVHIDHLKYFQDSRNPTFKTSRNPLSSPKLIKKYFDPIFPSSGTQVQMYNQSGKVDIDFESLGKIKFEKPKHMKLFNLAQDCVNPDTPDNKPKSLEEVLFRLNEIIYDKILTLSKPLTLSTEV